MEMPTGGWAVVVAAAAGAVKLLFSHLVARIEKRKWQQKYEAVGPSPGQTPAFAASPAPAPALPPPSHEVELQALRVRQVLIESELAEAQQALRRLRNSLDEAEREIAQKSGELVIARSMYDELLEASNALKAENAKIRMEADLNESRNRQYAAADQRPGLHGRHADRDLPPLPSQLGRRKGHEHPK